MHLSNCCQDEPKRRQRSRCCLCCTLGTDHRIHITKKAPDLQAVPSGSGRLGLGALQDQQQSFAVSHAAHPSDKALITAALSKIGFTMRSDKVSQHTRFCVCLKQVLLACNLRLYLISICLSLALPSRMQDKMRTSCGRYNTCASIITADYLCQTGFSRYCLGQQKLSVLPCTFLPR